VVATRVGGTSEIVRDGRDGLLVPYGNGAALAEAVERALETPWNRALLVQRARSFDWTDSVEHALDELNQALKRSS
jgi:glycosyltransferase involved in cell wall biosynthesis